MANPTTNYGWPMPTSTDLVTDLPADFAAFGQPVDTTLKALNPATTLGDLQYRSATANTNTRLPIGTTGQVLSVVGGVPAWTTGTTGDIEGVTAGTGISGGGTSGTVTVSIDTAVTVDKTTAQTLTNKTLTSPVLTTPTISTLTTNGDLLYGTGSGALSRIGIGSTSQVLTVTGGVPAWATPAAGGGMTLIASSSLSGSSVTISSIPGTYKHLMILIERAYSASSDYPMALRFSGDTGSNYNNKSVYGQTDANSYAYFRNDSVNATSMEIRTRTLSSVDAGKNLNLVLNVYNYASTSPRFLQGSAYSMNSGSEVLTTQTTGTYKGSDAISSVTALIPGTTWSGGTFSVYGVS